ncbi:MAG: proteasome assembly chaperone family protein [Candidatus Aenigmarchaeota archaeon]|nr:proteasome assembly chaperone family protein [Candidatus Aenigmarchaeota archaeon]
METQIKILEKIKMKNPVLVEGLPGIGNVGRVAAGYLVSELKMRKFAELYSPHFLPLVILQNDSVAHMLKCEFYYARVKGSDIIILTGDTQSISPEGHYDVCDKILDLAEKLGVKEIITLGGFAEGQEVTEPRVIGAVNDKKLLKKYDKLDIDFSQEHPVGTIVGASGLLLGMSRTRNIDALCLMGETFGLPLMTDPKAADKILHILTKVLGIKVDLSRLEKTIGEMEERIKRTDKIHKKMMQELSKPQQQGGGEDVKYIG